MDRDKLKRAIQVSTLSKQVKDYILGVVDELDELRATYKLMTDAGFRAIMMWKKYHPDQDMWPDQAANMVWLMEQMDDMKVDKAKLVAELEILKAKLKETEDEQSSSSSTNVG